MRRILAACLLALASLAGADVSVAPGPSDLYQGSTKLSTHERVEDCIDAAIDTGAGAYSCHTLSSITVQGSAGGACGVPDIGGWTQPVPTALDTSVLPAGDKAQPGTRLYYISTSGSDSSGVIYYWNGEQVVDAAGATYGTDPMNPVGVKPFKRWAWVGPRRATNSDIGTSGEVASTYTSFRYQRPDWWLFRRGDTFDLYEDFTSFDTEKNQVGLNKYSSLMVPGGASPTERQVVGAYGDPCAARPRFVHPINGWLYRTGRSGFPDLKHVLWQSLHFDGHDKPTGRSYSNSLNTMFAASQGIVIEDVWFDATGIGIGVDNAGRFLLRRVLITDAFTTDGSHAQGLYYEGTRAGVLRVEDSILLRNGFSHGDPSKMPWPPTGAQIWDLYDRNMYINGELDPLGSGIFDSVSMMGASGDQWRPGGRVQRNFFYQGYVNIGARGGYPDEDGFTAQVLNNVLQRFMGTGTNDNRGQPGWSFDVSAGSAFAYVAGNIVTGAQSPAKYAGMKLSPIQQDCYAQPKHPTRNNVVAGNILDSGIASAALQVTDGTVTDCFVDTIPVPGVTRNTMRDNVVINDKGIEHEYLPVGAAPATTDTAYSGNRMFRTRAEAAAALGWPDPDRTLKTYLLSQGVNVKSADGFPEYFERAAALRRGQWDPRWTSRELRRHVRDGFGMPGDDNNPQRK